MTPWMSWSGFSSTPWCCAPTPGDPSSGNCSAGPRHRPGPYAHQDLPFEHLVEVLNRPGRCLGTRCSQVMLAVQNTSQSRPAWTCPAGHPDRTRRPGCREVRFVLRPEATPSPPTAPRRHRRAIEYRTDLFDRATLEPSPPGWCTYCRQWWLTRISRSAGSTSSPPPNATSC